MSSYQCVVFKVHVTEVYQPFKIKRIFDFKSLVKTSIYINSKADYFDFWHPPALPYRLQYSTIGRLRLNRRVRDGNGCFP